MPEDFRRVLFPLSVLAQLFGFEVFEYPTGRLRPKLTVLYSGVLWTTFLVAFLCVKAFIFKESSLPKVNELVYLFSIASSFLSTCFMARNAEIYRKCLTDMAALDVALATLGSENDYQKLKKTSIKIILFWVLANTIIDTWGISYEILNADASYVLIFCYALNYALHATSIVPMQHYFLFRYAALRFDCIYEMIEKTLTNDEIRVGSCWEERSQVGRLVISQERERQRIAWTSMHAYLKLCDVSHELNKVFEVQICLYIILGFCYTIFSFLFAYAEVLMWNQNRIGKWYHLQSIIVWAIVYLLRSITPNHICEVATSKAARIKRIANRIIVFAKDPTKQDLAIFLLRVYHRPLRLSAMGLFDFGYQFVYQFFASAMTALVIILQLNSSIPLTQWRSLDSY